MASQLDVDAFGAYLGLGVPVVTFQVKQSDTGCCLAYQIYSLQEPPGLLQPAGNAKSADPDLLMAATAWKSVPAFKDGRAVASRLRLAVSAKL